MELTINSSWDDIIATLAKIKDKVAEFEFDTSEYYKYEEIFDIDYTFSALMSGDKSDIIARCKEFINEFGI